jgi:hypothetical protein
MMKPPDEPAVSIERVLPYIEAGGVGGGIE